MLDLRPTRLSILLRTCPTLHDLWRNAFPSLAVLIWASQVILSPASPTLITRQPQGNVTGFILGHQLLPNHDTETAY